MRRTLLILAFLALNASAADCLHTMLNLYAAEEYGVYDKDYEGYVPDSIYDDQGFGRINIIKYHRTGTHLDSTMEYFIDSDTTTQELIIYNDTTIIEDDGFLKTISIYKDGKLFRKKRVIFKEDYLFYDSDFLYGGEYQIRRDTLFNLEYENYIIVRDPEDENKCHVPLMQDSTNIIFWTYEHEIRGDTLIQTRSSSLSALDGIIGKAFYIYVRPEEETTRITPKRTYPIADWQKLKQFDLLGRPAKGKYTVKFSR